MLAIRVDGAPVPQPRPRVFRNGGVKTDSPRSRAWKIMLMAAMRKAVTVRPAFHAPVPVHVAIYFYLLRPKSHERSSEPTGKPDLDNLAKSVLDAAKGILWEDDSQIVYLELQKQHTARPDLVGVYIEVEG